MSFPKWDWALLPNRVQTLCPVWLTGQSGLARGCQVLADGGALLSGAESEPGCSSGLGKEGV